MKKPIDYLNEFYDKKNDYKLWEFFLKKNSERFDDLSLWQEIGSKYGKKRFFNLLYTAAKGKENNQNYVGFLIKMIYKKYKIKDSIELQNKLLSLFLKFKWLFFGKEENKTKYLQRMEEGKRMKLQKRKSTTKQITNKLKTVLNYKKQKRF